ncbi:MAG: hypothetical protein H6531_05450 [Actinobacteria bacterium]|nr:hypothetical protein [Thermoleophilia bacterium]MCB9011259.1 hypothetical protein [Actinomycetota bacterium]
MNPSELSTEQRMLGAAGALVLYAISLLFFPWIGIANQTASGWDTMPSPWIALLLALVGAGALAAAAFDIEIPVTIAPIPLAAYCSSVVAIMTFAVLLEVTSRKWGLLLAAVFAVVGVMLSVWLWREQDRS